jgi:hypothetical protein
MQDGILSTKSIAIFFIFIGFLSFSAIASLGSSFTSFLLYVFYAFFYLFAFNTMKISITDKYLKFYISIITILSIFGIIQFCSQFTSVGYIDLLIPNHMSKGFNTTNLVYLSSLVFYRAHSIYLEPSTFSQYSAVAILLLLYFWITHKSKPKTLIVISGIVNFLGIILSVSGTGLIVLFVGILVMLIGLRKKKKSSGVLILMISVILVVLFVSSNESLSAYLLNRLLEFTKPGTSGNIRFVLPYQDMIITFLTRPWGFGPGNVSESFALFFKNYPLVLSDINSSWGKVGVEIGVLGFAVYFYVWLMMWKRVKKINIAKLLFCIFLCFTFLGGLLLDTSSLAMLILIIGSSNLSLPKRNVKAIVANYYIGNQKLEVNNNHE